MNAVITKLCRRPVYWVTQDEAMEIMHCKKRTVYDLIKEMKAYEGSRYPHGITSQIGREKLIDQLVLQDYMRNRDRLKNKNLTKHVEPYDPVLQARLLGFYEEELKEDVA